MKSLLAGLIGIATLSAGLVSSRAQSSVLSGVVRDNVGAVAGGATVFVEHWRVGEDGKAVCITDGVTVADIRGAYTLSLKPGIYSLFISFPAMQPKAAEVEIVPGESKNLDTALKSSQLWKLIEYCRLRMHRNLQT